MQVPLQLLRQVIIAISFVHLVIFIFLLPLLLGQLTLERL